MNRLTDTARDARGFTMVELCVVIVVLGILMAAGITALLRARMLSNEASAIAGLRATNSAQFAYLAGCGQGNYATSYVILGTKPSPNSEGYISLDLGAAVNPTRNGYRFLVQMGNGGTLMTTDCNGNPTQTKYYAVATPREIGQTGNRAFAVNQSGSVYQAFGAVPPPEPFTSATDLAQ